MTYRPKPDGSVDPAGEAGWFLQRERELRREPLEDVARATKIHVRHLTAIEEGDLTELPARADTLRMVGVYAEYLGLDPQPLVLHYAQFLLRHAANGRRRKAHHPLSSATIIEFPLARRLSNIAAGSGGFVASFIAAALLFGAASWFFNPRPDAAATVASADVAAVAEVAPQGEPTDDGLSRDLPVASITTLLEEPLSDDQPAGPATATEAADEAANGLDGLAALIEQEVSPAATPAPPPGGDRVFGKDNADARLVLKAKAPVWIRIEDGKGNVVVTQTLMAGDTYRVPNRDGLVIIARDGGLLTYEVDGVARGSLGKPGEILVGRALDITKLASKG